MNRIKPVLSARNVEMFRRVLAGESYRAVAPEFGISHERVRQIVDRLAAIAARRAQEAGQALPHAGRSLAQMRGHAGFWGAWVGVARGVV